MNQAVLFDLDGTLLDSLADIALCGNTALEISGLPQHTPEEYRTYIGNGAEMLIRRTMTPEEYERCGAKVMADYMVIYGDLCAQGCRPFPGILEMLRTLRGAGLAAAVISNKPDSQTKLVWASTFGGPWTSPRARRRAAPRSPTRRAPGRFWTSSGRSASPMWGTPRWICRPAGTAASTPSG